MAEKVYKVNEIFYSLQGEGRWTGTPMVFVRFSVCNLRCEFCDTDFASYESLTLDEILWSVRKEGGECRRICLTGGEPSLQVDDSLVKRFHSEGYLLHIETNGTRTLPAGIDWVTLSPKVWWNGGEAKVILTRADEVKIVYTGQDLSGWEHFPAGEHFLQPCSGENTCEVVDYILAHPLWRLSLQTHKLLDIR